MKKRITILSGIFVVSFIFFNLSILTVERANLSNLKLDKLKIQFAHAAELPEVTITCSYGAPYDYCYTLTWKWCQNGNFLDYGCWATGNTRDSCSGFWATVCSKISI